MNRPDKRSVLETRTAAATVNAMPTDTTDARFTADVLESDAPVVVDFHAAWCPPCRVMSPILAELADERPDVRFVKVDVDDNTETAVRYGILSMPTFMVFRDGEPVLKLVGARPKRRLVNELEAVI
jgi:thioredoxin 1